ncbi:MAG: Flap endonuclease, partial [Acidobacteria bacterium]|nr:Flap endonuclease [Acidobacteriota bacterium]
RDLDLLFKTLATLRVDAPLFRRAGELRWTGATPAFASLAEQIDARLVKRVAKLATNVS